MKRSVVFPVLAACVLLICVFIYFCYFSSVTKVIFVRHAEKLNDTDTTSLSPAGFQRASALAHVVGSAEITRIFVSDKKRALQTAAPTATALGIMPVQIPAAHTDWLVDSINANRGKVILVVGHSNTLPITIEGLGITSPPSIAETEFDHLFVVAFCRCRATMIRLKYGNPS
jgi:broad specificity phosphatase PhoE